MANKTAAIVIGAIAGIGGALLLARRAEAKRPPEPPAPPEPPPPEPGINTLYGAVTSKGKPLSDVWVRIPSPLMEFQDYTDNDGYYEITGIAPGTYQVQFSLVGYNDVSKTISLIEGNNLLSVSMELSVGPMTAHLYGYITNHYTGAPVAGVTITLGGVTWVTETDGFYEFFDIVPSHILQPMTLVKDGYASQTLPLYINKTGDIRHDIVMVPDISYSCMTCIVDYDWIEIEPGFPFQVPIFWSTWDYDEYVAHMQMEHPGKPILPP